MTKSEEKTTSTAEAAPAWLTLMRHAKTEPGSLDCPDHDRELTMRGQRDAEAMGMWLAEIEYIPDIVLSSSAARARQTVELLLPMWNSKPVVTSSESLYLVGPQGIIDVVRSQHGGHRRVLIVAHNPGLGSLASMLAQQSIEMPTGAVAVFRIIQEVWPLTSPHDQAELVHFMRPKAL